MQILRCFMKVAHSVCKKDSEIAMYLRGNSTSPEHVVLLTSGHHILVFETVFVGSLSGWVVIHPNFTIVTPEHGVGFPKLQPQFRVGGNDSTATAMLSRLTSVMIGAFNRQLT